MTRKEQIKAQWVRIRWRRIHKLLEETANYVLPEAEEEDSRFMRELEELADYARNRATELIEHRQRTHEWTDDCT